MSAKGEKARGIERGIGTGRNAAIATRHGNATTIDRGGTRTERGIVTEIEIEIITRVVIVIVIVTARETATGSIDEPNIADGMAGINTTTVRSPRDMATMTSVERRRRTDNAETASAPRSL